MIKPWDRVQLTKAERKGKSFQELQALRIAKQGAPNAEGYTMFKFLFVLFNHLWVELEQIEAKITEKAEEDFEAELGKVAAWLIDLSAKVKALQAKLSPPPVEAPAPVEAAPAESAQEAKGDAAPGSPEDENAIPPGAEPQGEES